MTCIPPANGVPWISEAPQWWDSTNTPRAFSSDLNDVRWALAVRREYQNGTGIDATFRAVYMNEGGKPYLYLQWHVPNDPSLDNKTDGVFVGFQRIGGTAYVFEVDAYAVSSPGHPPGNFQAGNPAATNVLQRSGTTWVQGPATPTWLTESTRSWFKTLSTNPQTYEWAIAMRVPVNNSGADLDGGSALGGGSGGLNLAGASFRFFYGICSDQGQQTGASVMCWPRNSVPVLGPNLENDYGDPAVSWDMVQLGSGSTCGPGISLDNTDVGTTNNDPKTGLPAPNEILVSLTNPPTNHIYAHPYNNNVPSPNPIPAHTIYATFRTANWGSQVPWSGQFATGATPWQEITDGNPPPNMRNNDAAIAQGAKGNIAFDWTISTQQAADWIGPNATKWEHQCMLVTLSAPGQNIDFVNDSVYRNMDFVATSTFDRPFSISLEGLPRPRTRLPWLPWPRPVTQVFVRVELTNMPRTVPAGRPFQPISVKKLFGVVPLTLDHALTVLPDLPTRLPFPNLVPIEPIGFPRPEVPPSEIPEPIVVPTPEPIPKTPPPPTVNDLISHSTTIRYLPFYLTGRRIKIGGQIRPLLTPLTSFGHFIEASHPVYGWDHALGGAFTQVAPNVYKVGIQPGVRRQFFTRIVGYQKPPTKRLPPLLPGPIQSKIPILKNLPTLPRIGLRR